MEYTGEVPEQVANPNRQLVLDIKHNIQKVIIGQDETIDLLLVSLLADGHVLLEGVPGIAKTLLIKILAKTLSVDFSRIQFTPDLMPADILGTMVFNAKESEFEFKRGPLFSNLVLIDEINRAPAKTQAALFEVMQERQVTVDGQTYPMDLPYLVFATQNPIDQEGTYKLPEAQLDRFLFKLVMDFPTLEEEQLILRRFLYEDESDLLKTVQAVASAPQVAKLCDWVNQVTVKDTILDYIAAIVSATRNHPDIYLGASTRASLAILKTSKAIAAMSGRDFVIPEDVKQVCTPVMNHRIVLQSERELEGGSTQEMIEELVKQIEVPR